MAKEREIDWSKAHPWWKAAYDFAKATEGWHAIEAGSEEHKSWAKYFANLGWTPRTFQTLPIWTAPCQWPEWLGSDVEKQIRGADK